MRIGSSGAACALATLLAVVLGGCGGSSDGAETRAERAEGRQRAHAPEQLRRAAPAPPARGSPALRRWRNALQDLHRSLSRSLWRIGSAEAADDPSPRAIERADEALGELRACRERYAEQLAQPPDPRHAEVARLIGRACTLFHAGAEVDVEVLLSEPTAFVTAAETWSAAAELLRQANASLRPAMPWHTLPLPAVGADVSFSRVEPRLTHAAREVLGRDALVRCWSDDGWSDLLAKEQIEDEELWAFATLHTYSVDLSPRVCDTLNALVYAGLHPEGEDLVLLAEAVQTFVHEVVHLSEGSNEAVVECVAMQRVRDVAQRLGSGNAYAERLAETYWHEVYPTMPDPYRSPDCRPGGPLDRDPDDVWP